LRKFICSICGYVYDEAVGDSDRGISPGTKWEDISEDWTCPLCGAVKSDFSEEKSNTQPVAKSAIKEETEIEVMRELSIGELSALCSNLSKGCEKQYRPEEAELFKQLAEYYKMKSSVDAKSQLSDINALIKQDLESGYQQANTAASAAADRGALRALVWGEKVTKILDSLLSRYEKQKDALVINTHVYVCEICGFIFVGDVLPEICPICKVPSRKFAEIVRG